MPQRMPEQKDLTKSVMKNWPDHCASEITLDSPGHVGTDFASCTAR